MYNFSFPLILFDWNGSKLWIWKGSEMWFISLEMLFWNILLAVVVGSEARVRDYNRSKLEITMTDTLDELFKRPRYDPRLRPQYNDGPVLVTTGFWVLSIDSINVQDMAFGMDIFLRQNWVDNRLDHGLNQTLSLSNAVMSNIWLPDSYFKNAKQANFHEVTSKNLMITIGPKGKVHYNTRVTLKASCSMDLRLYPFDIQHCPLIMESCNWSGVMATFTFERTYSFYVIHIYGPSALIVLISWISFLLPRDQSPARVTLGVTSVLTEVTILTMSNNAMPKVNYVKAVDKYLIACFLFVFASLMEYSLILVLANRTMRREKQKRAAKRLAMEKENCSEHDPENSKLLLSPNIRCACHRRSPSSSLRNANGNAHQPNFALNVTHRDSLLVSIRDILYRDETILAVDEYSRKLFPLAFFAFNVYYWVLVFWFSHLLL
ncbi:glycine receptor subunit alpha-3 isoform X4 [Nematostella vectensis]|uniref:glycine receptor subunit alpha-3 isoform X4 n=1 Tax=Nematostella vectensis TaxID=45351 RepID=UPI0020774369|nr:glycine receptor subunit alpha-3 isoform X4 [Nematostella vectensis]